MKTLNEAVDEYKKALDLDMPKELKRDIIQAFKDGWYEALKELAKDEKK